MIISRAPFRVSFFGGGTDFPYWYKEYGTKIVSTSIDRYCYLTLRRLHPFYGKKYRISWSEIEEVNEISKIKHPAIKRALQDVDPSIGFEIHTDGDLPARSGVGSSSSFSAALLMALAAYEKRELSGRQLAKEVISFEQDKLGELVGIQDQIQASFGGFNITMIEKSGSFSCVRLDIESGIPAQINDELLLVHTMTARSSSQVQKVNFDNVKHDSLKEVFNISQLVATGLLNNSLDYQEFCSFLTDSWRCKRRLISGSTKLSILEDLYAHGIRLGARTGKLLGAGGGGFMAFLVPIEKQAKFLKEMDKSIVVKPSLTNNKAEVLYTSEMK